MKVRDRASERKTEEERGRERKREQVREREMKVERDNVFPVAITQEHRKGRI